VKLWIIVFVTESFASSCKQAKILFNMNRVYQNDGGTRMLLEHTGERKTDHGGESFLSQLSGGKLL